MYRSKFSLFIVVFVLLSLTVKAQSNSSIDETLARLSQIAAQKYIEPAVTPFGSNLNSGWVNMLPDPELIGFNLRIKFVGMGTFINDLPTTFTTTGAFNFTSSQADDILSNYSSNPNYAQIKQAFLAQSWNVTFNGPTIFGKDTDYLHILFPGGTVTVNNQPVTIASKTETLPDVKGLLNNLSIFPTACPQVTVGTLFGTQVSVRYLPSMQINDKLGKFQFFGIGILHNLSTWFSFPVDLGVGYFKQQLKIGDILETNASQIGFYISKKIGSTLAIIPYAGYTIETSTTKITYNFTYNTYIGGTSQTVQSNINFEMDGQNKNAWLVGATIKLAFLELNVDYKKADYNTASAGLTLAF